MDGKKKANDKSMAKPINPSLFLIKMSKKHGLPHARSYYQPSPQGDSQNTKRYVFLHKNCEFQIKDEFTPTVFFYLLIINH
jgi:hypothetical protein